MSKNNTKPASFKLLSIPTQLPSHSHDIKPTHIKNLIIQKEKPISTTQNTKFRISIRTEGSSEVYNK